jgi:Helicase associated domain
MVVLLLRHQHRLGGHRRVGAATATTIAKWWLLFSIIWWTTTFLLEKQQVPFVPFWCCSGFTFRLPPPLTPSRFTAARPNPNRLLLSVQSPIPDNNTGAKRYATAEQDEIADRRLSLRTERNAKEWNTNSTSEDNDRYSLIDHSSINRRQANLAKQWNVMFEKLNEYKTTHGDCLVPSRYKCDDGTPLGSWVKGQRKARYTSEEGKRSGEQRRQTLDSIGFVWIVNERNRQLSPETGQYASAAERFNARWNARFEQLKEYKIVHGHCQVPNKYECADGTKLGNWVSRQRMAGISDSETNPMRRQVLDAIGFVWQVREPVYTRDKQWNDMFQLLREYQAVHGDCLVPQDYASRDKNLGSWVQTQRTGLASGKLYKKLYQDRLQKLQSIGFELRALPDDSDESRWTRLFGQLVEYQRQHGDCLVPEMYLEDQKLGNFVQHLRIKGDSLSRDRREQLDAIGFVWDPQETAWNAKFRELQRFQQQHDHCLVSRNQHDHEAEYPGLVNWVNMQRISRHTMDTKRIQQLDSIGFVWDARDAHRNDSWNVMFEQLREYQTIHGDCKVPRSFRDKKLANWVETQRTTRTRTKLSPDQWAKLQSISFFP